MFSFKWVQWDIPRPNSTTSQTQSASQDCKYYSHLWRLSIETSIPHCSFRDNYTQREILFKCLPWLHLAIEGNRPGPVSCLLRLRGRLSSCSAQIRTTMRSLVAKCLTWFPKVCLYGKYSANLGSVDRRPEYYPKHSVIIFFCWLQQKRTKNFIPPFQTETLLCY